MEYLRSTATLSTCGRYRYRLGRVWGAGPVCTFVMLNPSTADAAEDDPTIRRCLSFAQREGCGSLEVVNLFAFRATDPKVMAEAEDPVGPDNDWHLLISGRAGPIIVAWGSHRLASARAEAVHPILGDGLLCLGTTKAGAPRHPLYVKGGTPLVPWA